MIIKKKNFEREKTEIFEIFLGNYFCFLDHSCAVKKSFLVLIFCVLHL